MLVEIKNEKKNEKEYLDLIKHLKGNNLYQEIYDEIKYECENVENNWIVPTTILGRNNGNWEGTPYQYIYDYLKDHKQSAKYAGMIFKEIITSLPNVYFEQKHISKLNCVGYKRIQNLIN